MIKNPPLSRRHALQLLGSGLLVSPVLTASANDYPTKPVELVVPAAAGGGSDALARTLADVFRKYFPQPLLVNNKPGASGSIGMTDVLNSKPDGYKVAMVVTELVILPHLGTIKFTHADFTLVASAGVFYGKCGIHDNRAVLTIRMSIISRVMILEVMNHAIQFIQCSK
jgi:tripartite-type tricarboxylate transporter receptor subunit TctC